MTSSFSNSRGATAPGCPPSGRLCVHEFFRTEPELNAHQILHQEWYANQAIEAKIDYQLNDPVYRNFARRFDNFIRARIKLLERHIQLLRDLEGKITTLE